MEAARLHLAGRHPSFGRIIHTIKVADLIQNTSSIVSEDAEFAKVYLREKRDLLLLLDRADERILERARQQIA
jgi:guanosine-3',5'-bis(diphosphate) 3'-pyrophosphohydrolase